MLNDRSVTLDLLAWPLFTKRHLSVKALSVILPTDTRDNEFGQLCRQYLNHKAGIKVFEVLFLSKLGKIFFYQKWVRERAETLCEQARLALWEGPLAEAQELAWQRVLLQPGPRKSKSMWDLTSLQDMLSFRYGVCWGYFAVVAFLLLIAVLLRVINALLGRLPIFSAVSNCNLREICSRSPTWFEYLSKMHRI